MATLTTSYGNLTQGETSLGEIRIEWKTSPSNSPVKASWVSETLPAAHAPWVQPTIRQLTSVVKGEQARKAAGYPVLSAAVFERGINVMFPLIGDRVLAAPSASVNPVDQLVFEWHTAEIDLEISFEDRSVVAFGQDRITGESFEGSLDQTLDAVTAFLDRLANDRS